MIPGGLESLILDAEFGSFILFEKIESDTAKDSEVMRAMAFAQADSSSLKARSSTQ